MLVVMSIMDRVADLLGFSERAEEQPASAPESIMPPPRARELTADSALRISTVYRAIEVLAVGVSQLGIDQWRGDKRVTPAAIIKQPDTDEWRSAFVEYTTVSLALAGDAFWRILRGPNGEPISLKPLNPNHVSVSEDPQTGRISYHWRGQTLTKGDRSGGDIVHLKKLRIPGRLTGLGPIEAARAELLGALQARDYSSSWFEKADVPTGILSTDQPVSAELAEQYRLIWNRIDPETGKRKPGEPGVRVLGSNLKYDPLQIKPADLQFLETQQFNTTQIARLFGTPASLMLAVVEGNSQSYSNVEQDWIAFTRFTLISYLREIEEGLSSILPYGNTVRFNVDALQRSDTTTRYTAHKIGIEAGFLTIPEVREIEGLDPLPETALTSKEPTA